MSNTKIITLANTSVATALEDVGSEIILGGEYDILAAEVSNLGASNALADFSLMVKLKRSGTWRNLITGTDWATAGIVLNAFTEELNTLALSTTGVIIVNVGPVYAIKFQADAAASTTSIAINGYIRKHLN